MCIALVISYEPLHSTACSDERKQPIIDQHLLLTRLFMEIITLLTINV